MPTAASVNDASDRTVGGTHMASPAVAAAMCVHEATSNDLYITATRAGSSPIVADHMARVEHVTRAALEEAVDGRRETRAVVVERRRAHAIVREDKENARGG